MCRAFIVRIIPHHGFTIKKQHLLYQLSDQRMGENDTDIYLS
ncbi:MAG: hypothetical protein R2788_21275 [Saprospiraceae bacterium]